MHAKKFHWLIWFMALMIHILFLISIVDMFPGVTEFKNVKRSIERKHEGVGDRAVIFLVAGLNLTLFYTLVHNSAFLRLNKALTECGSWAVTWSNNGNTRDNLLTLISGAETMQVPWFYKESSQPDLLTSNLDRVTYIGGRYVDFLNEIDNWNVYTYPEEWSNYTKLYDGNAMDRWIWLSTKEILQNLTSINNNTKELYLIYFEGLKIINKYDGKNSVNAQKAALRILSIIDDLINSFDSVYNDQRTVYILTSDFVRNDIKEYADDTISEFPIPILAWGAGIAGQRNDKSLLSLKSKERHDIDFKDITPLLACVLGLPTPAHSTGSLPFYYLKNNLSLIARCTLSNINQLYTLCLREYNDVNSKAKIKLSTILDQIDLTTVPKIYERFTKNIENNEYGSVIINGVKLMQHLQNLVFYYKNYYTRVAKIIICTLYLGWIIYLASFLFDKPNAQINRNIETNTINQQSKKTEMRKTFFKRIFAPKVIMRCLIDFIYITICAAIITITWLADWPITILIYLTALFLTIFGLIKYGNRWRLCKTTLINRTDAVTGMKFGVYVIIYLIMCVFFLETSVYTAVVILTAISLPYSDYLKVKNSYLSDWMLTSLFLVFFMSYGNDYQTNFIGIILQIIILISICFGLSIKLKIKLIDLPLVVLTLFATILAAITNCLIRENIITSTLWLWILTLPLLFIVIIGSNTLCIRLMQCGISLCIPYILSAKSYEVLTYFCIFIHLCAWFTVETFRNYEHYEKLPIFHDITLITDTRLHNLQWCNGRRAFMYVMGFFELLFAIIGNAFSTDFSSVSNCLLSQLLILSYLLMYPLNLWIISPSLMSLVNPCVTSQTDSDISLPPIVMQ
ncbi:hypothetical protein O3M35_003570 [Rhynocoris fuscipes]|uniref:GPI ethanolamine phosphate transferase 1 n=1 Tax=Rhynocoris fuscipes TaxID=488301 RepID=A0AAW1CLU7_9HEMI